MTNKSVDRLDHTVTSATRYASARADLLKQGHLNLAPKVNIMSTLGAISSLSLRQVSMCIMSTYSNSGYVLKRMPDGFFKVVKK